MTVKGYLGVLPANTLASNMNVIGTVTVSGTFWQSTQPSSIVDGSDTTVADRMTREAREHLAGIGGPDSWLSQCLDTLPQFITNYVAGIANDSR